VPGQTGAGSFNGLAWGPATKVHVSKLVGADDLPPLEVSDTPRPYRDGSWDGHRRLQPRLVTVEYTVLGDTAADYDVQVQSVLDATIPADAESPLLLFDSTRQFNAYVSRRATDYDATHRWRSGMVTVEYVCPDPRKYDANLQSLSTGLPSAAGGWGFPFGFPFGFGGAGSGGVIGAVNAGKWSAPATLTIVGPCANPSVSNETVGRLLKFGVTLASTDTLTVDLDQALVMLNGTANRNSAVSSDSQWWLLQPGSNTLRFNADVYSANALLTVAYRSAWA